MEQKGKIFKCLNCGKDAGENYCAYCGQAANVQRFGVKMISKDLAAEKYQSKGKHLKTFIELVKRPGEFAKEYLEGKRIAYTKPFTYYLFLLGIYVFLFHNVSDIVIPPPGNGDTQIKDLIDIVKQNLNYLSFVMPAAFALAMQIYLRKKNINLVESFIVSLYYFGTAFIIGIVFIGLIYIDPVLWAGRLYLTSAYLFYAYYSFAKVYGAKGFLRTLAILLTGYAIAMFIILLASLVYLQIFAAL